MVFLVNFFFLSNIAQLLHDPTKCIVVLGKTYSSIAGNEMADFLAKSTTQFFSKNAIFLPFLQSFSKYKINGTSLALAMGHDSLVTL